MTKVLLITLEYPPMIGGVAHYYFHLVKYWPATLKVIDNRNNDLLDNKRKFCSWWPAVKKILSIQLSGEVDYLLVGQILPLGTAAWLCSWIRPVPYAVIIHGLDFELAATGGHKRWLTRKILNRADKIIVANSYSARRLKQEFPKEVNQKLGVFNPGINPAEAVVNHTKLIEWRRYYQLEKSKLLLFVGRLVKRKGADKAIEAVAILNNQGIDVKLIIIGSGEEENNLKKLAQEKNIDKKIIFLNNVSDQDKFNWFSLADIFVLPAQKESKDYEGFGIVYLEAALVKKPVVAGRSGGVADAVIDQRTGLIIDAEQPQNLALAIKRLIDNPQLARMMGETAYKRVLSEFDWQVQARKIYDFILNKK